MWRQGQTHHPYTLSFLGTWGHGDTSLGYIDAETGTDTPPLYILISGDLGTRGHFSRIYRCGDRDNHTTPIHSYFWGHGDTSLTVLIVHRIVLFGPGSLLPRWRTEKQARGRCQLFIIYKCYSELFTSIDRTCERNIDFLN